MDNISTRIQSLPESEAKDPRRRPRAVRGERGSPHTHAEHGGVSRRLAERAYDISGALRSRIGLNTDSIERVISTTRHALCGRLLAHLRP